MANGQTNISGGKTLVGTAKPSDVRMGMTYPDGKELRNGTLDLRNLKPENIKSGVTIGGVVGRYNLDVRYETYNFTEFLHSGIIKTIYEKDISNIDIVAIEVISYMDRVPNESYLTVMAYCDDRLLGSDSESTPLNPMQEYSNLMVKSVHLSKISGTKLKINVLGNIKGSGGGWLSGVIKIAYINK